MAGDLVAKANSDGHTLLFHQANMLIQPGLEPVPYDVMRDFAPIVMCATSSHVIVIAPQLPVSTLKDYIAYAKARPGKISWGASTPGTVQHLSGEMFKRMVGIDIVFIPYKGTGAMLPDVLGGRLQLVVDNILVLAPHIKLGALNALAVTTAKRTPILPDVPSLAEAGVTGFDTSGWFSMYSTPKTPAAIIRKLNTEILAIVNQPDVRERLLTFGATPLPGTPEEYGADLDREEKLWGKVVKASGAKAE